MKEATKKWIAFAESDLTGAEYLFHKPKANQWTYLLVVWHAHQSIEKILKAMIVDKGNELLYIHDLPKLSKMADAAPLLSHRQKDFLLALNQYYITPRYPDVPLRRGYPLVRKPEVARVLKETRTLFLWLKSHI